MEYLIGVGGTLVNALFSPMNCVGNLGGDIITSFGNFAQCFGHNLNGSAGDVAGVVTGAAHAVSTIGA